MSAAGDQGDARKAWQEVEKQDRRGWQGRGANRGARRGWECDFHNTGSLNTVVDTLLHKEEPEGGVEKANSILLPLSCFADMGWLSFHNEEEILQEIHRNHQKIDNKVIVGLKDNRTKDYKDTNGIITYKGLIYVPHNQLLREHILLVNYSGQPPGH